MTTIIDNPVNIDKELLSQLVDLIETGGQVQRHFIEGGIEAANLIVLLLNNNEILSSATLKNPLKTYIDNVFHLAGVHDFNKDKMLELGYIITNPKYEGQKLCQTLLKSFFTIIKNERMFATTRKPSIVHILTKFNFHKLGNTYKEDLELLIYNPCL